MDNASPDFQNLSRGLKRIFKETYKEDDYILSKLIEDQKLGIQKEITKMINKKKEQQLDRFILELEPRKNGDSEEV